MRGFLRQRGRSMVEVILAMSIFSGTTALAVPEISRLMATVRLRSGMQSITDGLRLARDEAIRRNGRVVMCKSADGKQCTKAGDWTQGWIVFHDPNNSGQVNGSEAVLYREPPTSGPLRMSGNAEIVDYVSYSAFGKAKQLSGAFQAGTFKICSVSASRTDAYLVIFGISGRPRVQKTVVDHCG
jgi:type IV fimbrial biogenesis protein FimT